MKKIKSQCFVYRRGNYSSGQKDNFAREDNFTISRLLYYKYVFIWVFLLLIKDFYRN